MRAQRFRTSDIDLVPKVPTIGALSDWPAYAGQRMMLAFGVVRRLFVRPARSFYSRSEAEQVQAFIAGQHLQGRYFRGGPRY